jgi:hypothetical protein
MSARGRFVVLVTAFAAGAFAAAAAFGAVQLGRALGGAFAGWMV